MPSAVRGNTRFPLATPMDETVSLIPSGINADLSKDRRKRHTMHRQNELGRSYVRKPL
jgi:hypothetical protein